MAPDKNILWKHVGYKILQSLADLSKEAQMLPSGHEVHLSGYFSQVIHEESQDSDFLFPSGMKGKKSSFFYQLFS